MFIDERLTEKMNYGSRITDGFDTEQHQVFDGRDFRRLLHPYVVFSLDMNTDDMEETIQSDIISMFKRANGRFNSFRVKHPFDYSTNALTGVPTANDQVCEAGDSKWHITQWYDTYTIATAARRRILKPNAGSVLVGIRDELSNPVVLVNDFTVDYDTGEITFAANDTYTVTDITKAGSAVVTIGAHTLVVDDTVHFSAAVGMTDINGLRGKITAITATTITVDIDSSLFGVYSSAGTINTEPQSGELVTAGCYYDIPCVFQNSLLDVNRADFEILSVSVGIIETFNP